MADEDSEMLCGLDCGVASDVLIARVRGPFDGIRGSDMSVD